jgi:hypothetical protein
VYLLWWINFEHPRNYLQICCVFYLHGQIFLTNCTASFKIPAFANL